MKSRRVYDPRSTFFSQEILYFECLTQRAVIQAERRWYAWRARIVDLIYAYRRNSYSYVVSRVRARARGVIA